jgi:hypothetical protein
MADITKGVKYIKINRLDSNGEDYGARIQNADNIRINYPDIGPIQYDILTTQPQDNYYLLGVITQPITSSNPGRFGFSLDANRIYNTSNPLLNPCFSVDSPNFFTDYFFGMGNAGSATGDSTDFYSSGNSTIRSASYEFRRFSNEKLNLFFSCSIINGDTSNHDLDVKLIIQNSDGQVINNSTLFTLECVASSTSTAEITFPLPESLTEQGNKLLIFGDATGGPLSASEAGLRIIADPIDTPPETLLNISPEIINFTNTDDNAIFNNATTPQYSTIYQDIDYSTGLVPTNFELLVSGNADYASVQDSNYTATGWANSRYKGSRVSSTDFNV